METYTEKAEVIRIGLDNGQDGKDEGERWWSFKEERWYGERSKMVGQMRPLTLLVFSH